MTRVVALVAAGAATLGMLALQRLRRSRQPDQPVIFRPGRAVIPAQRRPDWASTATQEVPQLDDYDRGYVDGLAARPHGGGSTVIPIRRIKILPQSPHQPPTGDHQ